MNTIFFQPKSNVIYNLLSRTRLIIISLKCYIQKFVYVFIILTQLKFIVGPISSWFFEDAVMRQLILGNKSFSKNVEANHYLATKLNNAYEYVVQYNIFKTIITFR